VELVSKMAAHVVGPETPSSSLPGHVIVGLRWADMTVYDAVPMNLLDFQTLKDFVDWYVLCFPLSLFLSFSLSLSCQMTVD
jgi:hypothetical protein